MGAFADHDNELVYNADRIFNCHLLMHRLTEGIKLLKRETTVEIL